MKLIKRYLLFPPFGVLAFVLFSLWFSDPSNESYNPKPLSLMKLNEMSSGPDCQLEHYSSFGEQHTGFLAPERSLDNIIQLDLTWPLNNKLNPDKKKYSRYFNFSKHIKQKLRI